MSRGSRCPRLALGERKNRDASAVLENACAAAIVALRAEEKHRRTTDQRGAGRNQQRAELLRMLPRGP